MTYGSLSDLFKGICDAIRAKKGTSGDINHQDIPSEIESIQGGIDTSDATATAYDIAMNKTAYINGEKVTGRVLTVEPYTLMTLREGNIGTNYSDPDNPRILSTYMEDGSGIFMRNNSTIAISHSASDFGDAQASDVAAGKTFTSVAGVKVEGTGSPANASITSIEGYATMGINSASIEISVESNTQVGMQDLVPNCLITIHWYDIKYQGNYTYPNTVLKYCAFKINEVNGNLVADLHGYYNYDGFNTSVIKNIATCNYDSTTHRLVITLNDTSNMKFTTDTSADSHVRIMYIA